MFKYGLERNPNADVMCFCFRGKYANIRKHSGLLQLALAVVQSLKHPGFTAMDGLQAMEKGLLQCLGDEDAPAPLVQIMETFEKEIKLEPSQRYFKLLARQHSVSTDKSVNIAKRRTGVSRLVKEVVGL